MRPPGLRGRVAVTFGVGALVLSAALAASTFLIARDFLVGQRERTALRQAYIDAQLVRGRLETTGTEVADAIELANTPEPGALIVLRGGECFSSSPLAADCTALPSALQEEVSGGRPAYVRTEFNGSPAIVVGLPLPAVDLAFYRVTSLEVLDETLRILGWILSGGAALAAIGGTGFGLWASRKVMRPLNAVAATTAEIAGGRLDTRLPPTTDPVLTTIVGSFNSMVDSLQQRIEKDARFAADVSHELRSPLTTLVASVEVLDGRRDELPPRSQQALDLVKAELGRFRRLLDDLLYLARADAGLDLGGAQAWPLCDLLVHAIRGAGQPASMLTGEREVLVRGDKTLLDRAFSNLIENAGKHGQGLTGVSVLRSGDRVLTLVDDQGPGVPVAERDRIFERFATSRAGRGSSSGTGIGLALAAETIKAHGGAVWCSDRPGGGARFVVSLPVVWP